MVLGGLGTILVVGASVVIAKCPGDGQTGMCCCPLVLGLGLGIGAISIAIPGEVRTHERAALLGMATLSIASIVWAFVATKKYEDDWKRAHPEREAELESRTDD